MFGLITAAVLLLSLQLTAGHLSYPLDDAYIQMAVAKNLVLHGNWGVTRYGFSGSSSSPLWTLLIAGTYLLFGVNEVTPLVLSLLCGTLALAVTYSILVRRIASRRWVFAVCLLAVFLAPLPALAALGMEHALHAALSLALLWLVAGVLSSGRRLSLHDGMLLALLSALLTAARYEGLFLAFVACVLLLINWRPAPALLMAVAAALPPLAYGVWSVSKGGLFLPNSVLMKGSLPDPGLRGLVESLFGYVAWAAAGKSPDLLLLLIAAAFLLVLRLRRRSGRSVGTFALAIFIGTALLHLNFAQAATQYRYDAYLMLIGLTAIAVAAWELRPAPAIPPLTSFRRVAAALLLLFILSPLVIRSARFIGTLPQATKNIYEQQYQMGRFLARYYPGRPVAVNDIGAVSYLADVRLLDLWGLADPELARLRLHNQYREWPMLGRARQQGADIALVHRQWFLAPEWVEVGMWRISGNVTCAHTDISLCAVDSAAAPELERNLIAFAPELPAAVEQSGPYTRK